MSEIFDSFFTGINYWASKSATHMWRDYDAKSIEKDMELLQKAGVTMLRVFPNWEDFQPLTAFVVPYGEVYEYGINGKPLPKTSAGEAGIDEVMFERFEDFCQIADKYGMKLIVGLITGHMSFGNMIPPALVNLDLMSDPKAVLWEVRYVKYLVTRFCNIENIVAWDLGNEVENIKERNTTKEEFHVWTNTIYNAIKTCDPTRPVASGVGKFNISHDFPNLYDLAEGCDINTVHAYNIFDTPADPVNSMKPVIDHIFKCRLSEDIGKMPTFLQEFGAIGYANCSEKSEAEFYRACVLSVLSHGFKGTMYWCAFDQGHLTFPPYNWNNIGSDYGFFDKELKAKPVAEENMRLKPLVDLVGNGLPKYKTNCTIVAPREIWLSSKPALRTAYLLAKRANLEPSFAYAIDEIPESDIYILPSVKHDKAITNTNLIELLERVKKGATLYISLDKAYFRRISELAGVCINNRVDKNNEITIRLNDKDMTISSPTEYDMTEGNGEVLARDKKGTPVFVKNKYGEGNIYVLFVPVEEYLDGKSGAFYEDDAYEYEEIYKTFANDTKNKKLSTCDSRFINCTEHYAEDGSVFIFAINYSNRKQSARLTLNGDYELTVIWGSEFKDDEITLSPCDGILLRATKL